MDRTRDVLISEEPQLRGPRLSNPSLPIAPLAANGPLPRNVSFVRKTLVFFLLSLPLLFPKKAEASSPSLYLQTGNSQTTEAVLIHSRLAQLWEKHKGFPNLDKAGFLQIYLDVLRERPLFPYFAGLHAMRELRFVNYGDHGFFIGRRLSSDKTRSPHKSASQAFTQGAGAKVSPDFFEPLEWGAVYLTDETLKKPLFMRQHVIRTHSLARARRSFAALSSGHVPAQALREGYVLVWNGGLRCLARLQTEGFSNGDGASGLQCDAEVGKKLKEINDLSDDEQFFYLLSGQPFSERRTVCKAAGTVGERTIEGFGVMNGSRARCILHRERVEDSWGLRSKVHCLNPLQNNHLWGNFDHVDFVFPTSSTEQFVLVESRFDPPRLTRIDLMGGHSSSLPTNGKPSEGQLTRRPSDSSGVHPTTAFSGLPRGDYGMYQCQSQHRGKPVGQLFFVSQEIYLGKRRVNVDEDRIFSYHPNSKSHITSEVLRWAEMMHRYPLMDQFPELSCAYGPSLDVKCGVRILQNSAQVLQEEARGELAIAASAEVRKSALLVVHSLLGILKSELGNWGLQPETDLMLLFAKSRLEKLSVTRSRAKVDQTVGTEEEQLESNNQGIQENWRVYLSVPESFWEKLAEERSANLNR